MLVQLQFGQDIGLLNYINQECPMELLLFILFATLLGIAAQFGVDSSDSSSDPRRPLTPVGLS